MNPPTSEQCEAEALVWETDQEKAYAIWYPQMGGYVSKAVVVVGKEEPDSCFEAYVWHDGDFPFHEGENPAHIHHCSAGQFIEFGEAILKFEKP